MESKHAKRTYRVVLVGNAHVGKTAIIKRLVNRSFSKDYQTTVGTAFYTHIVNVDGKNVFLQIWDTAGEEKYMSLGQIYFRNTAAAVFVYDQTDKESFDALKTWISAFRESSDIDAQLFIAGNKADLSESQSNAGQMLAEECRASFFSVSALTGQNIDRMFQSIANDLITLPYTRESGCNVTKTSENAENKKCC